MLQLCLIVCSIFPPGRYCSGRNPSKKSSKAAKFRESKWTWYQAMTKQGLPYINHNTYSLNVITDCFFFAPRHLHEWLSFLINLGEYRPMNPMQRVSHVSHLDLVIFFLPRVRRCWMDFTSLWQHGIVDSPLKWGCNLMQLEGHWES